MVPSCRVDLTRYHPRPCLQYYIKRCLGPCVEGLTTPETYQEAVRDVKLFLEGRPTDLLRSLRQRMAQAAEAEEYERAAKYRDLISTVDQLQEKQRIAAVEGDDADVFGYHCENGMLAVNLFHMRGGKVLDRREFFWEDLPELVGLGIPVETILLRLRCWQRRRCKQSSLRRVISSRRIFLHLAQTALHRPALCSAEHLLCRWILKTAKRWKICSPSRVADKARATRVNILVPQRGDKRSLLDLAGNNAKQSYDQRFRVHETKHEGNPGGAAGRPRTAGAAAGESNASTSRISRGRRPWRRWWCGKTGR